MQTAFLPSPNSYSGNRVGILPGNRPLTRHEKLVQATRQWVALSFFEPMLKEMRNSPFKSKLFDGGEAGQAFDSMYDQTLAGKMASGATDSLVQSIVRKIEGSRAYAQQAAAKKAQANVESEREGADRIRGAGNTGGGNVSSYF